MFDVTVDPAKNQICDLQIILVEHEHVAVRVDAHLRQMDERHVPACILKVHGPEETAT
jgi:hypothetical protein